MTEPDDLDTLVTELNAGAPRSRRSDDQTARLRSWLEQVVEQSASDLLLVAGAPPSLRIDGHVVPLDAAFGGPLCSEDIDDAVTPALPPHARRLYHGGGIADGSFRTPDLGRFRINLHHERGRAAAAIRRLPPVVPRFATLNLPPTVEALIRLPRGLVLVGGPTGSGKTTTLAALVNEVNHRDARHIITIEDPIEYEHPHRKSVIEQIEVGVDAPDFPTALRAALRQAPDIIVVGEMRDPETMQIAVAAGETGHLVFSSLNTRAAVLTQTLMPKIGGGLIPAAELLMVGYGARQQVRKNALHHLHQEITITRKQGSFTLEESLTELVKQGLVDRKDAMTRAGQPEELERLLS